MWRTTFSEHPQQAIVLTKTAGQQPGSGHSGLKWRPLHNPGPLSSPPLSSVQHHHIISLINFSLAISSFIRYFSCILEGFYEEDAKQDSTLHLR